MWQFIIGKNFLDTVKDLYQSRFNMYYEKYFIFYNTPTRLYWREGLPNSTVVECCREKARSHMASQGWSSSPCLKNTQAGECIPRTRILVEWRWAQRTRHIGVTHASSLPLSHPHTHTLWHLKKKSKEYTKGRLQYERIENLSVAYNSISTVRIILSKQIK